MIVFASNLTGSVYKRGIKPLLFKLSPDRVHLSAIRNGKVVAAIPPARWAVRKLFRYDNPCLSQTIVGQTFQNPVGLSAGFDKNFELLRLMPALGFGFVEGGSLTALPSAGNKRPHYRRLKQSRSILVNAGLNNHGVTKIINRIKGYGTLTYPLNISVAKTNDASTCTQESGIADYVQSVKAIQAAGVGDMLTINISCPNAFGGEPFTTPAKLEALLSEIDKVGLTQPVFVKMPIDLPWSEFDGLLRVVRNHSVMGVTIGNLAKNRDNQHIKDELPDDWSGNMSGKPTWDLSNELISKTYLHYGDSLVIIGVGGIFTAADAYEKIKRGASLVEVITGLIFEGPQVVGRINRGLAELLRQDGYEHISQAIGAHSRKNERSPNA